MVRRCLAAALLMTACLSAARAEPGPCVAGPKEAVVCGQGADALTVLPDTGSPSGKLAIGWRLKPGAQLPSDGYPDGDDVEDHVVRLVDGKSLGLVVGRGWNINGARGNHIYLTSVWSPDERWLLVADSGKWSLEAIAIYAVDAGSGAANGLGIFTALKGRAFAALGQRIGKGRAGAYELQIPGDAAIKLTKAGKVTLPLVFQVPKQDMDVDAVATFTATRSGGKVSVSDIQVRLKK